MCCENDSGQRLDVPLQEGVFAYTWFLGMWCCSGTHVCKCVAHGSTVVYDTQ